jgi:cbb3-type cytochrome oxidase maturation protein
MGIIILLISISVVIAVSFLGVFYWNIKSGQYDDTYTPSVRILFDDKTQDTKEEAKDSKRKTQKL